MLHSRDDVDDDGGKERPHAAEAKALLQEILGVHDGQLAFRSCRSLGTRPVVSLRSKWTTLCELLGEEDALRVLKHSPNVLAISTDTMLTALPTLEKVQPSRRCGVTVLVKHGTREDIGKTWLSSTLFSRDELPCFTLDRHTHALELLEGCQLPAMPLRMRMQDTKPLAHGLSHALVGKLAQVLGVAHARAAVLSNGKLLEVYSPNVEGSLIALSDVLGVDTAADVLAFHPQVPRSSCSPSRRWAEWPSAQLLSSRTGRPRVAFEGRGYGGCWLLVRFKSRPWGRVTHQRDGLAREIEPYTWDRHTVATDATQVMKGKPETIRAAMEALEELLGGEAARTAAVGIPAQP